MQRNSRSNQHGKTLHFAIFLTISILRLSNRIARSTMPCAVYWLSAAFRRPGWLLADGCQLLGTGYLLAGSALCVAVVCCLLTIGYWLLGVWYWQHVLTTTYLRSVVYMPAYCWLLSTVCWLPVAGCHLPAVVMLSIGLHLFHSHENLVSRSPFQMSWNPTVVQWHKIRFQRRSRWCRTRRWVCSVQTTIKKTGRTDHLKETATTWGQHFILNLI